MTTGSVQLWWTEEVRLKPDTAEGVTTEGRYYAAAACRSWTSVASPTARKAL